MKSGTLIQITKDYPFKNESQFVYYTKNELQELSGE